MDFSAVFLYTDSLLREVQNNNVLIPKINTLRSHDCVYSTSAPLLAVITTNTFDISVGDNTFSPRDICFLFVLFIRLLVTYGLLGGFYALLGKMGN